MRSNSIASTLPVPAFCRNAILLGVTRLQRFNARRLPQVYPLGRLRPFSSARLPSTARRDPTAAQVESANPPLAPLSTQRGEWRFPGSMHRKPTSQ